MKILVINPMSTLTRNVVRDVLYGCWCAGRRIGGGTVPPFGLLQIATVLEQDSKENSVTFVDCQAEQIPSQRLAERAADFECVIASTSTMSFKEDAAVMNEFKKNNPRLKTILFGSHPTFMPEHSLTEPGIDICVRHEPEFIIRDLIRALRNQDDQWKNVLGINYKDTEGKKVFNPRYPPYQLDELPLPNTDLLPKVDYFNPLVRRLPYITTVTSKGCPARCIFCTAPYFDDVNIRYKSIDYLKREITHYIEKGYREIYFRDDTFFVNKTRDQEFCRWILDSKVDISWICNTRVSTVRTDRELLELAHRAGCHTVKIGVESGVQEILNNLRKGQTVGDCQTVFGWMKEIGINSHAHVMLGNPGDTKQTIEKTIEYVLRLEPKTATFGICTPYPGTPLFDEVAKKCPELLDGTDSDFSKLHTSGTYNEYFTHLKKTELEYFVRTAYRKFYLRPSYIVSRLSEMRDVYNFRRVSLAATNVFRFSLSGE
ncbi:MAG: radical SAM protein [Deltaproteobacteria bacterium]|nr:radical SAM protein [Deltaproteobacteria bacterium]